jgi:hypothetical protein
MTLSMIIPDLWWIGLMIPGFLLGLYAQFRLRSAYGHYVNVPGERGLTGAEAARVILDRSGLASVPVHEVPGHLSDHYDPGKRALFLSSENFRGASVAALGVAAHEAGHALQHQASYLPMNVRMALVPVTNLASNAAMWITVLGYALGMLTVVAPFAVGVFGVVTLFQVVTLPVEFDASRRAREHLVRLGLVTAREQVGVSRVLSAAALTYVAAMVASMAQLLYFVMLARGGDRR